MAHSVGIGDLLSSNSFFLNNVLGSEMEEGGSEPAKLFHRPHFIDAIIKEGGLLCTILATFNIDLEEAQRDFDSLLGLSSAVPTLIIHGDKGSIIETPDERVTSCDNSSFTEIGQKSYRNAATNAGVVSDGKQEDSQSSEATQRATGWEEDLDNSSAVAVKRSVSGVPYEVKTIRVPKTVAIEEILPHWHSQHVQTTDLKVCAEAVDETTRHITPELGRKAIQGVHHAKYIMAFTDRGLYVAISTGNISKKMSSDGTWTEFFPLLADKERNRNRGDDRDGRGTKTTGDGDHKASRSSAGASSTVGSDFGRVLQNFLDAQSKQTKSKFRSSGTSRAPTVNEPVPREPIKFIKRFVGIDDISSAYDFSVAQVDLVTTVPCRQPLPEPSFEEAMLLYQTLEESRLSSPKMKCSNGKRRLAFPSVSRGLDIRKLLGPPCKRCQIHMNIMGLGPGLGERVNQRSSSSSSDKYDGAGAGSYSTDDFMVKIKSEFPPPSSPPSSSSSSSSLNFLYGAERCSELLRRNCHLLPRPLTDRDIFFAQPTSIGSAINNFYIGYFLSRMMPEEEFWSDCIDFTREECWKLMWPTESAVRRSLEVFRVFSNSREDIVKIGLDSGEGGAARVNSDAADSQNQQLPSDINTDCQISTRIKEIKDERTTVQCRKRSLAEAVGYIGTAATVSYDNNSEEEDREAANNDDDDADDEHEVFLDAKNMLFLQPETLALMELDIHTRMFTYEPSYAPCIAPEAQFVPHIKSYGRVMIDGGQYGGDEIGDDNKTGTDGNDDQNILLHDRSGSCSRQCYREEVIEDGSSHHLHTQQESSIGTTAIIAAVTVKAGNEDQAAVITIESSIPHNNNNQEEKSSSRERLTAVLQDTQIDEDIEINIEIEIDEGVTTGSVAQQQQLDPQQQQPQQQQQQQIYQQQQQPSTKSAFNLALESRRVEESAKNAAADLSETDIDEDWLYAQTQTQTQTTHSKQEGGGSYCCYSAAEAMAASSTGGATQTLRPSSFHVLIDAPKDHIISPNNISGDPNSEEGARKMLPAATSSRSSSNTLDIGKDVYTNLSAAGIGMSDDAKSSTAAGTVDSSKTAVSTIDKSEDAKSSSGYHKDSSTAHGTKSRSSRVGSSSSSKTCSGDGNNNNNDDAVLGADCECTCYPLAWYLLTSACLSRGAQGIEKPHVVCEECGHIQQGFTEYKNFELGVMFHTRPGLQYKALNPICPRHATRGRSLKAEKSVAVGGQQEGIVVILPVPFDVVNSRPYCNEVSMEFEHRPYFHSPTEIATYNSQMRLPETTPQKVRRKLETR